MQRRALAAVVASILAPQLAQAQSVVGDTTIYGPGIVRHQIVARNAELGEGDQVILVLSSSDERSEPPATTASPAVPPPKVLCLKGYTLVPLRYIAEWLGASVSFDRAEGSIAIALGRKDVRLKLGSNSAMVDGKVVMLSTPALEQAGVTYVPLRFIGETFGARVEWNAAVKTVIVHHPSSGQLLTLTAVPAGPSSTGTPAAVRPQDGHWEGEVPDEFTIRFAVAKSGSVVTNLVLRRAGAELRDPREVPVVGGKFAIPGYTGGYLTGSFTTPTTAEGSLPVERWTGGIDVAPATVTWKARRVRAAP